jgi:uncharacterized coiled-coil DUF342 family protein
MKKLAALTFALAVLLSLPLPARAADALDLDGLRAIVALPPSVAVLESEIKLLDAQSDEYKSQLGELDRQLKRYGDSLSSLDKQEKNLGTQEDSINAQRGEVLRQIGELRAQLALLPEETPENAAELAAARAEIDRQIDILQKSAASLGEQGDYVAEQIGDVPEQRDEYQLQIGSLNKQRAALKNQIDSVSGRKAAIGHKINKERMTAEYRLQIAYYNVCSSRGSAALLELQLAVLDKQIAVETVKLGLGVPDATQNAIDALEGSRGAARGQLDAANAQTELYERGVAKLLRVQPASIVYEMPAGADGRPTRTLDMLINRLYANNSTLIEYSADIKSLTELVADLEKTAGKSDTTYKLRCAELDYAVIQRDEYRDSLASFAAGRYGEFYAAELQYASAMAQRRVSEKDLELLRRYYDSGEISELEFLTQQAKLCRSLSDAQAAIVAKANILSEIELLAGGVALG